MKQYVDINGAKYMASHTVKHSDIGEGLQLLSNGTLVVETATEQEINDIITGIDDILEVSA